MPAILRRFAPCWPTQLLLTALAVCICQPGCVRRRMTVRSNPPGALVYVDDQQIGTTPVSTPFTYYGPRKIQVVADGYETTTVKQRISPPWYQWPLVELITENFWPGELRDERVLDFQLEPQRVVSMGKLKERAEGLRTSARQGFVAPLVYPPAAGMSPAPPPAGMRPAAPAGQAPLAPPSLP